MSDARVVQVEAAATYLLRQRVLRPHQAVAEVGFPGESAPDVAHFAAYDAGGQVIGVVTVLPQPPPHLDDGTDRSRWWRLRGMATAEEHRRRGVGAALVAAALGHVAAQGATVLWCYARVPAVGFYQRAGFSPSGDEWEEPSLGPHRFMLRTTDPDPAA